MILIIITTINTIILKICSAVFLYPHLSVRFCRFVNKGNSYYAETVHTVLSCPNKNRSYFDLLCQFSFAQSLLNCPGRLNHSDALILSKNIHSQFIDVDNVQPAGVMCGWVGFFPLLGRPEQQRCDVGHLRPMGASENIRSILFLWPTYY